MPLTPADVRNVAFTKSPTGERGYDEDEVDAFLDDLHGALARLIQENQELRAQLASGGPPAARLAAEVDDVRVQLDRLQRDRAAAEQAAHAMRAELARMSAGGGAPAGGDGDRSASPVVAAARRTADDHVAAARRAADEALSTAHQDAEQVTGRARTEAETLEQGARRRHEEAIQGLRAKRAAAQAQIEELLGFRREYQAQLKAHIESQLGDLDGREPGP